MKAKTTIETPEEFVQRMARDPYADLSPEHRAICEASDKRAAERIEREEVEEMTVTEEDIYGFANLLGLDPVEVEEVRESVRVSGTTASKDNGTKEQN